MNPDFMETEDRRSLDEIRNLLREIEEESGVEASYTRLSDTSLESLTDIIDNALLEYSNTSDEEGADEVTEVESEDGELEIVVNDPIDTEVFEDNISWLTEFVGSEVVNDTIRDMIASSGTNTVNTQGYSVLSEEQILDLNNRIEQTRREVGQEQEDLTEERMVSVEEDVTQQTQTASLREMFAINNEDAGDTEETTTTSLSDLISEALQYVSDPAPVAETEDMDLVSESGVEEVSEEGSEEEEDTGRPIRRVSNARNNDYTLAWDIYQLGYATGDIAYIYNTSAGSISRGIKKDGHLMRTGAETRAMSKVSPNNFEMYLIDSINDTLADKFETDEERNRAFNQAFGINLYELTLYEADDNDGEEIVSLREQATEQGISLAQLAEQSLSSEQYAEREMTEFTRNVREVHEYVLGYARDLFGDVNVDTGALNVVTTIAYKNGVSIKVSEAHHIKAKVLEEESVSIIVNVAEYLTQDFARETEQLYRRFNQWVGQRFTKDGEPATVSQLGNRMVVGIENE